MPSSVFPQIDFPRVVILIDNGVMPGDEMMAAVTRPIEEAMKDIPGVVSVRSATGRGSAEVNVFFNWSVDMEKSELHVQSRLSQIRATLPATATTNVYRLTFSAFPIIGISLTSTGGRSQTDLWERARYNLKPRLLRIPGIARVDLVGGRTPEYHVRVDPRKLEALSIGAQPSQRCPGKGQSHRPGRICRGRASIISRSGECPRQVDRRHRRIGGGSDRKRGPVRIKDVAEVVPGQEPQFNIVTADGRLAVLLNIRSQPDGNTVAIADAVRQQIEQMQMDLPPDYAAGGLLRSIHSRP